MTWVPDVLVSEDLRAFDTAAHANAYLTSWRQNEESDALADRVFDGVSVTSGPTSTGAQAAFVVGTEAFTLRSTSTSVTMTAAAFDVLIQAAIMRAEPTA